MQAGNIPSEIETFNSFETCRQHDRQLKCHQQQKKGKKNDKLGLSVNVGIIGRIYINRKDKAT